MNASSLYAQMLQITSGRRGCIAISKKAVKVAGLEWSFVEAAAEILNLRIERDGRWGYLISK